jgi:cell wall-associated NlpC family hydrolase
MLCDGSQWKCATRTVLICTGIALFFVAISEADARTRRQRRATAFQVALQPFSAVRSAIHELAEPIVHSARAEYDSAEDDSEYLDYEEPPAGRVYQVEPVRIAERANRAEPVRVAYVTTTRRSDPAPRPQPPHADQAEYFGESEPPRRAEMPDIGSNGSKPMVAGSRAVLRNGVAYAPSQAPQSVKNAIWAANTLRRKPYVWGGGHGSFYDRGYDCSGTVSFALYGAGALDSPLPSSEFMRYGERGRGRWITVYSRRGHTFAVIAGLRLDTTDFQNGGNTGPRWHEDGRDTRGYVARHPAGM